MRHPSIPTRYANVQFRSRLEARWGALFDLLRWRWEYEPDVGLRGYIPDFLVWPGGTEDDRPLLAEAKPFTDAKTLAQLAPALSKIKLSGWTGDTMLLGSALPLTDVSREGLAPDSTHVIMSQRDPDGHLWWCATEIVRHLVDTVDGEQLTHWTPHAFGMPRACRVCYAQAPFPTADGGPIGGLRAMWAAAGNAVQWRAPAETKPERARPVAPCGCGYIHGAGERCGPL